VDYRVMSFADLREAEFDIVLFFGVPYQGDPPLPQQ